MNSKLRKRRCRHCGKRFSPDSSEQVVCLKRVGERAKQQVLCWGVSDMPASSAIAECRSSEPVLGRRRSGVTRQDGLTDTADLFVKLPLPVLEPLAIHE